MLEKWWLQVEGFDQVVAISSGHPLVKAINRWKFKMGEF
jgi:hypothetical protein